MSFATDDYVSWIVRRVGFLTTAVVLVFNAAAVAVVLIFLSDNPTDSSENFLSLLTKKLDAFLFFVAFLGFVGSAAAWWMERMRPFVKTLLPWLVALWVISGVSWWIFMVIQGGASSPRQ